MKTQRLRGQAKTEEEVGEMYVVLVLIFKSEAYILSFRLGLFKFSLSVLTI